MNRRLWACQPSFCTDGSGPLFGTINLGLRDLQMNPTGYCGLDAFQHVVCNVGCVSKPSSHYTANFPDTLCLGGRRQSGSMSLEYCPVICYKRIFNCWSLRCLSLQWSVDAIPFCSWEAISTLIHSGVKKALGLEMEAFKDMSMLSENEGHSGRLRRGQACTLEYGGGVPLSSSTTVSILYLSQSLASLSTISHLPFST